MEKNGNKRDSYAAAKLVGRSGFLLRSIGRLALAFFFGQSAGSPCVSSQRQVNESSDSSKLRLHLSLLPYVRPTIYAIHSPYTRVISATLKNIGIEFDNRLSNALVTRTPDFFPLSITSEGISISSELTFEHAGIPIKAARDVSRLV